MTKRTPDIEMYQRNLMDFGQFNLYALQRLIDLATSDPRGLPQSYEDALDILLFLDYADISKKHEKEFEELMQERFEDTNEGDDVEKFKRKMMRIAKKEALLSMVLYENKIKLSKGVPLYFEDLAEVDFNTIIQGESLKNGLPEEDGDED